MQPVYINAWTAYHSSTSTGIRSSYASQHSQLGQDVRSAMSPDRHIAPIYEDRTFQGPLYRSPSHTQQGTLYRSSSGGSHVIVLVQDPCKGQWWVTFKAHLVLVCKLLNRKEGKPTNTWFKWSQYTISISGHFWYTVQYEDFTQNAQCCQNCMFSSIFSCWIIGQTGVWFNTGLIRLHRYNVESGGAVFAPDSWGNNTIWQRTNDL